MTRGHWTEQQFIDSLYGVGPEDGHLNACAECRARHESMIARKRQIASEPEIPFEFLAAQRRAIHRRLDQPDRRNARFLPVLAASLVLVAGFFAMKQPPAPTPAPKAQVSDTQLFADIYALEQSSEPRAAGPVRALFEEN
ncbi:MAG: hypothetical protein JSU00_08530 [Acidobacteria bacterium]|nr:hypothetical protein [Acidobacteriota bacterium]